MYSLNNMFFDLPDGTDRLVSLSYCIILDSASIASNLITGQCTQTTLLAIKLYFAEVLQGPRECEEQQWRLSTVMKVWDSRDGLLFYAGRVVLSERVIQAV